MIWRGGHHLANLVKPVKINSRIAAPLIAMRGNHARPAAFKPIGLVWKIVRASRKFIIKMGNPVINDLIGGSFVINTFGNQPRRIDLPNR